MTFSVVFADEAKKNLNAAYQHYLHRSPRGANNWFLAFERAYESLARDPERFAVCPENETHPEKLQQINFGTRQSRPTHRLIFVIRDEVVYVLSLRHLHQDVWRDESLDEDVRD